MKVEQVKRSKKKSILEQVVEQVDRIDESVYGDESIIPLLGFTPGTKEYITMVKRLNRLKDSDPALYDKIINLD
jgi:hypothetical protein